jgi:Flp pilus assembly protein TadD
MQPRHLKLIVSLFLIVATFAVYGQVRNHDFVNFDDQDYVTENRHVQDGLTLEGLEWAFTTPFGGHWYPLTWLSHMTDFQLFGLNAGRHHLTSLLIHMTNTLLLFFVFNRMTGDVWRSGFVAALFALHPLHVESVAWVSDRKDVLSAFFWIVTMWSYVRYVERPRTNRYLLVVIFFVLGLMSKATLVTLPFVLLLLDYWPLGRLAFGQSSSPGKSHQRTPALHLVWEKTPFFIMLAAASVVTYLSRVAAHLGGYAAEVLNQYPLDIRIANALVSYVRYIVKMVWPSHLTVFYPHPSLVPWWQVLGACLLLLAVSVLAIRVVRSRPYFVVGWLWFVGTLVPVIGLVQIGAFAMADRYTYVPIIGLFIIIAWAVPELLARLRYRKIVISISTGVVLSAFMISSWQQVRHWQNSVTLFAHALNVTTDNWLARNNLGNAWAEQGNLDKAVEHYSEALRIAPDFAMAHNNLGFALAQQGRFDEAISHYTRALKIDPAFAEAHTNMGNALASQGRLEEAISHCSEAVRIQPTNAVAHNNLGNALARQGHLSEAIRHFTAALRIEPDYAIAHYNLGIVLAQQGKLDEAITHLSEALRIRPDFPGAQENLRQLLRQAEQSDRV